MEDRKVLDLENVGRAIEGMASLFSELDLTVAETIHSVRSVDASLKAMYPEAYRLMAGLKADEPGESA